MICAVLGTELSRLMTQEGDLPENNLCQGPVTEGSTLHPYPSAATQPAKLTVMAGVTSGMAPVSPGSLCTDVSTCFDSVF